jgi:hypothetical protein
MSIIKRTAIVLLFLLLVSDSAYAYLDPGTGSMILSTILGGVAGLLVAWKLFWHRIRDALGLGKKDAENNDPQS